MQSLSSNELRKRYLEFFCERGHSLLRSASLIPENDPTVLFTTAGMHPLVPYLMGSEHPLGKRLVSCQKCVRTVDIDEVGDDTHCTFFEMLGNWSLGDYFKKESIDFSYDFAVNVLGIPRENLAVTVFSGDDDCPKDDDSAKYWANLGIKCQQIYYLPKKNNWWGPAGLTGPCGPDTEIFCVNEAKPKCSPDCSPACDCGRYIEIWNNVFMQYNKLADGTFEPLKSKNVDTGLGLERTVAILNGCKSVYEIDLFKPAIEYIERHSGKMYGEDSHTTRAIRIIADHMRTATFLIGDEKGVVPSNSDQGYVLRRLIRRAVRYARQIGMQADALVGLADVYVEVYKGVYDELVKNKQKIYDEIIKETGKFERTLSAGLKEFEKVVANLIKRSATLIDGKDAFRLYDTFGFPIEITEELAADKGLTVDKAGFEAAFYAHQQKSQAGAEQKFVGGLHDHSEETTKLHTATHLLQAALRRVLGESVYQRGSNITAERLRFDFSFERPMTKEEIEQTQNIVNEIIDQGLAVVSQEMNVEEAKAAGAVGLFDDKYEQKVKVYCIGDFSKEICGGPHVENTKILGSFKIDKEQSSSSGVRRIKASLEKIDSRQ